MAELYVLTVTLAEGAPSLILMYDGERNARRGYEAFYAAPEAETARQVAYRDDFGTEGWVWADQVAGIMMQNCARAFEAGIRRAVLQNEANMKANRQAQRSIGGLVTANGLPPGMING